MTQSNDSVTITPGSGATIATHLADGKEFQAVVVADENGYLSLPTYMAASYRIAGLASTPQNLMTIENTTGASKVVAIRRIAVDVSVSAVTAYLLTTYARLWHVTGVTPTGGTQPAKTSTDSAEVASQANTIIRFGSSADGTASAITHALPARSPDRSQAHPTLLTGVGQWLTDDLELMKFDMPPLILRAGQTLLLALSGANSAATLHYTVKVIWQEF